MESSIFVFPNKKTALMYTGPHSEMHGNEGHTSEAVLYTASVKITKFLLGEALRGYSLQL
jgi:hypothetical protein